MNRQKFLKTLQSLSGWRERAFILALAERAAPNAALYFENLDTSDLEKSIDLAGLFNKIWQHLIIEPNEDAIIECLDEVVELMKDLRKVSCDIMTIGQYLQPYEKRLPVERYVKPEEFAEWKRIGEDMGFKHVESSPLTRSSYHAREQAESGNDTVQITRT